MVDLLCLWSEMEQTKPGCWCIYLQDGLLTILSPLLRPTAQKKKIPFRMLLLIDNTPGYPRALIGMYDVIVFMLPTKHPF